MKLKDLIELNLSKRERIPAEIRILGIAIRHLQREGLREFSLSFPYSNLEVDKDDWGEYQF